MKQTHIRTWLKKRWALDRPFVVTAIASFVVSILAASNADLLGAHFFQRYKEQRLNRSKATLLIQEKRVVLETTSTLHKAASDAPSTLVRTVHPVSKIPNWGAMRSASEWNRSYSEMKDTDFVAVPPYHLSALTIPLLSLTKPTITQASIPLITAKLYYSTRYMAKYDLDADEHSGTHDGVDLKLAPGTPIGAIGGGKVIGITEDEVLGLHILVEHQLQSGERYLSIYGHLSTNMVTVGQAVTPGQIIGTVGMTGNTSGPHLHLGLHKKIGEGSWDEYEASESVNPMTFMMEYAGGEN